jgi:hypothetical protein
MKTAGTEKVAVDAAAGHEHRAAHAGRVVVPEPSTLAGLAMGVVGIGIARSRRRG